jgi:TP901 family phage tail tape measure protein
MARGADGRFIAGIELGLKDQLSGPMGALAAKFAPWGAKAAKMFSPMEAAAKKASKAFGAAANLKHAADGVKNFSQGMAGALGAPVKKMAEFEDIMAKVRANTFNGQVTEQTQKEFKELGTFARDMGAKTKFSGVEAAEGLDILATAGFDAKAQMAGLPGILDLAAASNQSIAEAAEISTSAMSQFGLKATDLGRIGDVIAKTAQSSKTGLLDLGEAMKYAGVSAANAGVSIEETTAMLGALGDAGVKGSAAGTALRSVFSSLQAPTKKGKSALDFLGINTKDKSGNMRPINDILKEMDAAMDKRFGKDKNGNRRANLLKGLFDEANAASASLLIAKAGSGALEEKINQNLGASGTAAKVAADMGNSTAGSARELSSAFEELQLSIGGLLIPTVREFIDLTKGVTESVTAWAKEHPELVKWIGLAAGGLTVAGVAIWGVTAAASVAATTWGVLTTAWGLANGAIGLLTKGMNFLKVAMLTNPIIAIITGIALAAGLIYTYWEPIKAFFSDLWEGIKNVFKSVWDWIVGKIEWVGEKINWLKENLLGMKAEVDWGDVDKEYAARVGKMSKEELRIAAASSDEKLSKAATGMIRMMTHGRGLDPLPAAEAVAKATSNAPISGTPISLPPALAALMAPSTGADVPVVGTPQGTPIAGLDPEKIKVMKGKDNKFMGQLDIKISGVPVESTQLKTNTGTGFQVRVNTGAQ